MGGNGRFFMLAYLKKVIHRGCISEVPDLRPSSAHGDTPTKTITEAELRDLALARNCPRQGMPIPKARYRPASYAAG
jgi:hypothetical protein